MSLLKTLVEVGEKLDAAGVEYVIRGSLASSVWGQARATRDVDVAAIFTESQLIHFSNSSIGPT